MNRRFFLLLLLFVQLSLFAQSDTTKYGVVIPQDFTYQLDVVYDKVGDWEGKMDIYLPPNEGAPTPLVINIHGGGWARNSKEKETGFHSFFKNKVAIANMSYRLTGTETAPAAVEDVRSVLIYLMKNAVELNIDANKIVLMGSSAGGHLAMMGGYLQNDNIYDKDKKALEKLKVAAVINKYGVADMVDFTVGSMNYKSAVKWMGEKIDDVEFIKTVSPMTYVNKKTPPTLIIHGDADDVVPYTQSVRLKEALDKCKVKNRLVTLEGVGHTGHDRFTKSKIGKETIEFLRELELID